MGWGWGIPTVSSGINYDEIVSGINYDEIVPPKSVTYVPDTTRRVGRHRGLWSQRVLPSDDGVSPSSQSVSLVLLEHYWIIVT